MNAIQEIISCYAVKCANRQCEEPSILCQNIQKEANVNYMRRVENIQINMLRFECKPLKIKHCKYLIT